MRSFSRAATGLVFLAGALGACGGGAPTPALDPEDRKQSIAARANALEHNKTGQATNWSNPNTGHRGTVVPTRTYKSTDGADCREFQQTTTVAGETDLAFGASCRESNGAWRVVSEPSRFRPGGGGHGRFGDAYGRFGDAYGRFGDARGRFGYGIGYPYYHYGRGHYRW